MRKKFYRALPFVFLFIFSGFTAIAEANNSLQRNTQQGAVKGFDSKYHTLSWQGIPYASPPTGDLRWKAPRPPALRKNILLAHNNTHMCLQKSGPLTSLNVFQWEKVVGSEDCLYLNIVAPADLKADEKLPVMFWIHGGGNSIGYKGNRAYTGEKLSSQGRVVFVAINYRLGPLGWFYHPALASTSTKNMDASGNYGTLDIIAALQWVQENIHYFGGDSGRVTVFGESAGGLNVYSLLASPLAKDLFHHAIVESGGYFTNSQSYVSQTQAQGGHSYSSSEITKTVLKKSKSTGDIKEAHQLARILRDFDGAQLVALYPSRAAGMLDFPALNRDGYVLPLDSHFNNAVPVILGTNKDENKTFMALDPELVTPLFGIRDKTVYNKVAYYLSNSWKLNGVDKHARDLSAKQYHVYAYRFDWDNLPKIFHIDLSELIGAGHGLEIPFVFGELKSDFNIDILFSNNASQRKLSQQMLGYWSNFAHTGNPNEGVFKDLPRWSSWNNAADADKFVILDSGKNGIRMSSEDIHEHELKQMLAQDSDLSTELKCKLYQSMFLSEEPTDDEIASHTQFLESACINLSTSE